jgi:tetratricopeptide (TPR) repeat protein
MKRKMGLLLLVAALSASPARAGQQDVPKADAANLLHEIDVAIAAGRLVQADAMLSWIEAGDPDATSSEAAFRRAEYHMASGNADLAAKALQAAGNDAGSGCRRKRLSGWIAGKTAKWNPAILQLSAAVENCPVDAALWNWLGLALVGKREFAAALEAFDSALHIDPRHPALHNNRALALVGLGQYDAALADVKKALALSPVDRAIRDNADYLSGVVGAEPVRTAADSDTIWASRLARTGDGARDANRNGNAYAYFANAALLMDRFDAHIWAQSGTAETWKAD